MPHIKALFFDFGNVCVTFDFFKFLRAWSAFVGCTVEEARAKFLGDPGPHLTYSRLFEELECGTIAPCQFFHEITTMFGVAGRIDYDTFAAMWSDIFLAENHALDALLSRIATPKYLLSNTNKIVFARYVAHCNIMRNHFPAWSNRVLSYQVGAMKPNKKIYEVAFARAGVLPEETLFVDDVHTNVDTWRSLGGHGIVYNAHHDPIELLEHKFRELNLLN